MEEQKINQTINQTPTLKLLKMSKGNYNWEIRACNDDLEKAVEEVEKINNQMLDKFGGKK